MLEEASLLKASIWLRYLDWNAAQKYLLPEAMKPDQEHLKPETSLIEEDSLEERILSSPFLEDAILLEEDPNKALNNLLNRLYEENKPIKVGHYPITDNPSTFYSLETPKEAVLLAPGNWVISRVPKEVLGEGVLGRCWPNTGIIEILNTLTGADYEEVQQHEFNHLLHPEESESQVRYRTRCMGHDKYN